MTACSHCGGSLPAPTLESTESQVETYLESLEPKERLEQIANLLHRLNFERRFAELTPEEVEHMTNPLSPATKAQLDAAKDDAARERLIQMHARAFYFRECAWAAYLNGETPDKPFTSPKEGAEPAAA